MGGCAAAARTTPNVPGRLRAARVGVAPLLQRHLARLRAVHAALVAADELRAARYLAPESLRAAHSVALRRIVRAENSTRSKRVCTAGVGRITRDQRRCILPDPRGKCVDCTRRGGLNRRGRLEFVARGRTASAAVGARAGRRHLRGGSARHGMLAELLLL